MFEIAASQHAVISASQLRDLGADRDWVRRRVAAGMMRALLARAYVVGPEVVAPSPNAWRMAALLSCTGPAALSHQAAAERWGAWDRSDRVIHVVSKVGRADVVHPRICFHRTCCLLVSDVATVDGIPITTMVRTILDLGVQLTPFQIAHVIYEAVFLRLLDVAELESRFRDHRGEPGSGVVRYALALYRTGSAGTRSRTEDQFLNEWLSHALPEPMVNNPASIAIAGIEPDFVWPERRLIVEIDGDSGHGRPGAKVRDDGRDNVIRREGWRVLRFPASKVWRDLDGVIASVRSAW